ncbi:N-6 DNA methylase [Sphingobacterium suaedae]|uniref:N-6 DNA methylase n=1 Tax=Sphingobacterium suaedae TaxID=1686402 RepID=A0ABW5KET8_9SPHI
MKNSNSNQISLLDLNQKDIFKNIKNFLAGRFIGATRERALLEEVVKCLYCKYYLIFRLKPSFENGHDFEVSSKYHEVFSEIKKIFPNIFAETEKILLDSECIIFVDSEFEKINFEDFKRDPFGDLYEVFINTGVREEEGQFFTPLNGVELLVNFVKPQIDDKIIDPAAGAGGFLSSVIQYFSDNKQVLPNSALNIYGIEKDGYLAKLSATRLSLLTLSKSNVFCGDSLAWKNEYGKSLEIEKDNFYDVVLTNPPFGKKIIAANKEIQKSYDLGYEWKYDSESGTYEKTNKLLKTVPPQVLFVEKCIKLLKAGGRLGIVLPESLITSKSYSYVVDYMRKNGHFKAIIGMPEDFFKTSGKGGTHTKACLILYTKNGISDKNLNDIFMAEARWCGHDSRGRIIVNNDLPIIIDNYKAYIDGKKLRSDHLGYLVPETKLENNTLSPRYYNPVIKKSLSSITKTHDIVRFGDLVADGKIEIKTGNEVGKLAYGTGNIPFVRTSDISNWEIKLDPKHGLSQDIYNTYSKRQDVKEGDILMVKDGTYLIGTCAMVSKYDEKIVYQSHLYKIRVIDKGLISPYLLLAILSSTTVQDQIKAKRFTQDIIDSLGSRIHDLILPVPKDQALVAKVEKNVKTAILDRIEARELARQACLDVISTTLD